MKTWVLPCFFFVVSMGVCAQTTPIPVLDTLVLSIFETGKTHKVWLKLGEDNFNEPIQVPVLIAKGTEKGQVLGLTAAIHGNELNGIAIIHKVFSRIDASKMKGTIIAIPGLNPLAIGRQQREFVDQQDLNRLFPGKEKGNRSQQMAFQIGKKIIPLFNYHIDLHTASFGRVNSLYGRGNMDDDTLATMLRILQPDIIVSNKGEASFGEATGLTMRAFAIQNGVKSITMEYGNPQVFQKEFIERGVNGIQNLLIWLKFIDGKVEIPPTRNVCKKSYWVYTDRGGYLDVLPELNQQIGKDEPIAVLFDSFGAIIKTYYAPEDGVVIGKSTNPVSISGGRILHLGILEKP
ncbi:succinylglutamate desuccinylase/aspartoacylase family protein [Flagellimonas meishanensis]|uniref:succinylglutamate desuccinylase/aspartoacylase family protein n=1 Tax=Flagellimonas meishanensis TaxID=2873264 RepID=UPI001CA61319|nr:succinylglutamate desuccinylase/aspartoacylase family protein [[Muricauda] meishanensis]